MRAVIIGALLCAAVGAAAVLSTGEDVPPVATADPFVSNAPWDDFTQRLATANTAVFVLSSPQLGAHGSSIPMFLAADRNANRVVFYPSILGDGGDKIFLLSGANLWRIQAGFSGRASPLPHGAASQAIALEVMSGLATSTLSNEQGGIMVRFPFPWATGMSTLVDVSRTSVPQSVNIPGALFFTGWGMGATLFIHDVAWDIQLPPSFYQEPSGLMASTIRNDLGHLAVSLPLQFKGGSGYVF
jgi:hypothetical protein